jgi:pheromone shutdown protein TraB
VGYLARRWVYNGHKFYSYENNENRIRMQTSEPNMYAEKCLDPHRMNWFIQTLDIFFPKLKVIFIDKRDDDLFRQIDSSPHKRVVAVVNQWHMEGIEHEWAARYG